MTAKNYRNWTQPRLPHKVPMLAALDLKLLQAHQIQGIILELDNTIISEDDRFISPYAETWIQQAQQQGIQFFILSNGKRRYRVIYWSQRLGIPSISPARKPFPFSFHRALKQLRLKPENVAVIGDNFHTDVLGAWLTGCHSIQVNSLPHPKRWWEKIIGRWVQTPYPAHRELWWFDIRN